MVDRTKRMLPDYRYSMDYFPHLFQRAINEQESTMTTHAHSFVAKSFSSTIHPSFTVFHPYSRMGK
jgi:hypothetical protein